MAHIGRGLMTPHKRTATVVGGCLLAALTLGAMLTLLTEPAGAAFPGKNGKIVFASDRLTSKNPVPEGKSAPDREIFVMSASGTGVKQLTHNERDDLSPAFSATGKKIVFTSDRVGTTYEVFVMNADGTRQKNVTRDDPAIESARDADPSFSPSGKKIVFASDRSTGEGVDNPDRDMEIFTIKPDGTGLRQLTHNGSTDAIPSGPTDQVPVFSPDGKKIAFTTDRDRMEGDYNTEIYTMDANGGNEVNLTRNSASDGRPDWSPDGKKIVFPSLRDSVSTNEVYTMRADGSGVTRLTTNNVSDSSPVFSPDGRQIAFHSFRDGNSEIYRMKANGSLQTMVSDEFSGGSFLPDWQPVPGR